MEKPKAVKASDVLGLYPKKLVELMKINNWTIEEDIKAETKTKNKEWYPVAEMDAWNAEQEILNKAAGYDINEKEWRQKINKLLDEVDEGDFRCAFDRLLSEDKP